MSGPVHMVFINAVLGSIVLVGWYIYTFVYPKKKMNLFFLLIIISLLPIVSIFRSGVYESGDFNLHLYREIDFYTSLQQGNLMPSWAGQLNAHYGYPLFLFLNPLPYYLIALFHFIGFSFINSMKLFLATAYVLSGIFMYLFSKNIFKKSFPAFAAAIFYLFMPYHLIDQHFRVDVGEIAIYMTLPLVFYAYELVSQKQTLSRSLFLSISIFLLILSHQAMAFFSLLFLFSYIGVTLWKKKTTRKLLFYIFISCGFGLLISLYILLPYEIYTKFLHNLHSYGMIFGSIQDLFFTPWRFGFLFQGPKGQLGSLIGYTQLMLIPLAIFHIWKYKKDKFRASTIYWIFVTFICFILMFPESNSIWQTIPLIHLAVLANRLLLLMSFSLAILAGIIATRVTKRYLFLFTLFLIITIAYTILNWGNRRTIPTIGDTYLINNLPNSTSQGEGWPEAIPVWKSPRIFEKIIPNQNVAITKGQGVIKTTMYLSTNHTYIVYAKTPITITDNTWYFPGWKASVDNKPTTIQYINTKQNDVMTVQVPSGLHTLQFVYQDIFIIRIMKIITLIGLAIIFFYFVFLFGRAQLKRWR